MHRNIYILTSYLYIVMVLRNIDAKDKLLLELLEQNGRMPLSILSKKAKMLRETTHYRIVNLKKEHIIQQCVPYIDISALGLEVYAVFINLKTPTPEIRKKILEDVKKNPYITWASIVGGVYDLIIAIQAPNATRFKQIYAEFSDKFKENILEEQFSQRIAINAYGKENNLKESKQLVLSQSQKHIDFLDKQIMLQLKDDARKSVMEIAHQLQKPVATIQSRLKTLEKNKIITGYGAIINHTNTGKSIQQLLLRTTALHKTEEMRLKEYCRTKKETLFYVESIAPWNYELSFVVDNDAELQNILNDLKIILSSKLKQVTILVTFDYFYVYRPLGKAFEEM